MATQKQNNIQNSVENVAVPASPEKLSVDPMQARLDALEKKAKGFLELMEGSDDELLKLLEQIRELKENQKVSADAVRSLEGNWHKLESHVELMAGDKLLYEKLNATQAVAEMLDKDPKLKAEDLQPTDVVKNPELLKETAEDPTLWDAILMEAKGGIELSSLLRKAELSEDPSTWIKHHGYKAINKYPEVAIAAALGVSAYAAYKLFFDKNDDSAKLKGGIAAGVAAGIIGFSLWGSKAMKGTVEKGLERLGFSKETIEKGKKAKERVKRVVTGTMIDPETGQEYPKVADNLLDQHLYIALKKYESEATFKSLNKAAVAQKLRQIEENGHLPEQADRAAIIAALMLDGFAKGVITTGGGILTLGVGTVYTLSESLVDLVSSSMAAMTKDTDNSAEVMSALGAYASGYVVVFGAATAKGAVDFMMKSEEIVLHRILAKSAAKSLVWPVYGVELSAKTFGTASKLGAKAGMKHLGSIEVAGKSLKLLNKAGEVVTERVTMSNFARNVLSAGGKEVVDMGKGRYHYKGIEFKLSHEENLRLDRVNDKELKLKEAKSILEKKWNSPQVAKTTAKGKFYTYRGASFFLSNEQAAGNVQDAIDEILQKRMQVDKMRVTAKGATVEINGKTFDLDAKNPGAVAEAKAARLREMKAKGEAVPENLKVPEKFARFLPLLKTIMPVYAAIQGIRMLEEEPNKEKAVAEFAAFSAAAYGGMKASEFLFHLYQPKSPGGAAAKVVLSIVGAIAASLGLTAPIERIISSYLPKFETEYGSLNQAVYSSVAELMESAAVAQGVHSLGKNLAKMELNYLMKKKGPEFLVKRMEGKVLTSLRKLTAKSVVKNILTRMGVKAGTSLAILADDATVIGVLDDLALFYTVPSMFVDGYEVIDSVRRAYNVQDVVGRLSKKPIAKIDFADQRSRNAFNRVLQMEGISSLEEVDNQKLSQLMFKVPDLRMKTEYEGSGSVEMHLVNGELVEVYVVDVNGEKYGLDSDDLAADMGGIPPIDLKPVEIDYEEESMPLVDQYRAALLPLVVKAGWTRMKYEVVDENQVVVSRVDTDESLLIERNRNNSWSLKGVEGEYTLEQAAALANLVNKISPILEKEGHTGDGENPFEVDGGSIDFNKNFNLIDLRILDEENNWVDFYKKIGLKPENLAAALNNWYRDRDKTVGADEVIRKRLEDDKRLAA